MISPQPPIVTDDAADLIHIPATDLDERVHTEDHLLLWQARGAADFSLLTPGEKRWTSVPLVAGHALWLPAGVTHRVHVHANSTLLPTFYPVSTCATRLPAPVVIPVHEVLQALILARIQQTTTAIQPEANTARQILALIEATPDVPDALPTPVSESARRIAEMIRFNPGDSRRADELAAAVHTSLRTVQRRFIAETGMNLQQWRTRVRLETGAALLRSGNSVNAVATRVGYSDVSSFCRAFKRDMGRSTSEYLKQFLGQ